MKRWSAAILALSVCLLGSVALAAQPASAIYPAQQGYVDANGVLIYYVEFGRGAPFQTEPLQVAPN